jgi:hypothetical protein
MHTLPGDGWKLRGERKNTKWNCLEFESRFPVGDESAALHSSSVRRRLGRSRSVQNIHSPQSCE